ncbi:MAG: GNAT family N-acetyltransferase [Propionibacteriaceae bacterium]|nr:GNAT family N-acetyltransferase [Propionibacteriaceae bacterium]
MEALLIDILTALRNLPDGRALDGRELTSIIRRHNKTQSSAQRPFAKKWLLPFYRQVERDDPARWRSWSVDQALERRLIQTLQMKPRRNASGVTTITVVTKPWICSNNCLYCPSDVTMPRSYLRDEPACQRAEQNYFDPYLQVCSRLATVTAMGHTIDKIELIILGGTWSDYPKPYQAWFVAELFRALNDADRDEQATSRRAVYAALGLSRDKAVIDQATAPIQAQLDQGRCNYNQAVRQLYQQAPLWSELARWQRSSASEVKDEHDRNQEARCKVVGLSVETRPDKIVAPDLVWLRSLGVTKVQIGIQTLDPLVLARNNRATTIESVAQAFALLRLFGFKVQAHAMLNLLGADPDGDLKAYRQLFSDQRFRPDEIKLYPCSLVQGTGLVKQWQAGAWQPYNDQQLLDLLVACVRVTPGFTRISRMVRDISAADIVVGNTKSNFREAVEAELRRGEPGEPSSQALSAETLACSESCELNSQASGDETHTPDQSAQSDLAVQADQPVAEMRFREIRTEAPSLGDLRLDVLAYDASVTQERFLQWVTPDQRLVGFLRLSWPQPGAWQSGDEAGAVTGVRATTAARPTATEAGADCPSTAIDQGLIGPTWPLGPEAAMIREVHVYGRAIALHQTGAGAQHLGLGRQLVEAACQLATDAGFARINVISAVGTRGYYRRLGFVDAGLYQSRSLTKGS